MEHFKNYFNNLITNSPLITIPFVTYFGYLFAYKFEIGSAKYYNIPEYLVHIELLQVFSNAILIYILIFTFGLFVFKLIHDFLSFFPRLNLNQINLTNKEIIFSRIQAALLVLVFLFLIPDTIGNYYGGKNKYYIVFQKDNKQYAIVKIYDDTAIALAIASESGVLTRDVYIFPKDQTIKGTLKYSEEMKVGR